MAVREKPTWKQRAFARAYVEGDGNGTEAVFKAGYKVKSREVARAMAPEILAVPSVKHEIRTWQERLEASVLPSLDTIEKLRDSSLDERIKLAASRDLLNRAGIGKAEAKTSVLAVFANMDEAKLLEKMAMLVERNGAKPSPDVVDVSPTPSSVI